MTAEALPRDPYAGFREGLGISGQPIPIVGTTGCQVLDAAPEGVLVRLPVTRALVGQDGRLLPGAIAIVADVACGWAAHAAQQHAGFASTAQLRLEFVRPLPPLGAAVVVRATCDSATADAGLARGEIVDENDELLAVCSVRTIPLAAHRGAAGAAEAVASVAAIDLTKTPLADVIGLGASRSANGEATLELHPGLAIANSAGAVHGGALALIGYLAASEAQRSVLAADEELHALDLVINYYRAVPADGSLLTCTASVAHRGRRFLVAEGHLVTADGRIAARVSCGAQVRAAGTVLDQQPGRRPKGNSVELRDNAEEAAFRAEVRDWLSDHLVGEFAAHPGVGGVSDDSHWELRLEWEKLLAEARLLNITWPREYGGRGGTLSEEIIFHQEHAAAAAPYWVGVHGRDLFGPTLLHFGTDEQKSRFLPAITGVREFWGQGFSEPGAGSDLAGLRTRAERDGDEWVINGQKIWMTFGAYADWLYVLCRTDPDAPKHKGISLLLVPARQPGIDIRPIRNIAGSGEFCEVFFTDARTKADLVVGPINGGWGVAMGTVGAERVLTTLPYAYAFEREFRSLVRVLKDKGRTQDPLVRQRIADAWSGLEIIRYTNLRLITGLMQRGTLGSESSVSKLQWAQWHRDLGELEMELLGLSSDIVGDNYELDEFQRSFLNSRAETIYGGAVEIQRTIVGERVLGLAKEPS